MISEQMNAVKPEPKSTGNVNTVKDCFNVVFENNYVPKRRN